MSFATSAQPCKKVAETKINKVHALVTNRDFLLTELSLEEDDQETAV